MALECFSLSSYDRHHLNFPLDLKRKVTGRSKRRSPGAKRQRIRATRTQVPKLLLLIPAGAAAEAQLGYRRVMAFTGGSKLRRQLGSSKLQVGLSVGVHEGQAAPWHASSDGLLAFTSPAALPDLVVPVDGGKAVSHSTQEKMKTFKSFRRMFSVRQRKSPAVPAPAGTAGSPDHPLGEAWRRDLSFFRFDDYLPEDAGMPAQESLLRTKGAMPTQARGAASSENERKRASKGDRRKTTKGSRRAASEGTGAAESQRDERLPSMSLQYGGGISLQVDGRMPLQRIGRMPMQQNGRISLQHNGRMPMQQNGKISMQQNGRISMQHNGRMPMQRNGRIPMQHSGVIPLHHDERMPPQYEGRIPARCDGRTPQQYEGTMPGYHDGNMTSDYARMMALQYDGRISSQYDSRIRPQGDRKIRKHRRPSERNDRV